MTAAARGGAGGVERAFPRLIVITDLERAGVAETIERFQKLASAARPGTVMVQLRDKERSARERLALGRELAAVCRATGQLLQVNDRLDLAGLLEAEALHLGETAVDTSDARRMLGSGVLITRACHDVARVGEVDADGVVLSPILAPRKGRAALGIEALQKARERLGAARSDARLVALGGVDGEGARQCFQAGADGVAVVGAWLTDRSEGLLESAGIRFG